MMSQKITKSPLAELGVSYLIKDSAHAGILLDPDNYTLEFYPKGYTQVSDRDNRNRQLTLKAVWELAVTMGKEEMLYPFESVQHNIKLIHDRHNTVDKHAVRVILECPFNGSRLQHLDGMDLGFVPQRISKQLCARLSMINGGRILKIRANWHKRYYTAKVILGYEGKFSTFTDFGDTVRFTDIMDEIG